MLYRFWIVFAFLVAWVALGAVATVGERSANLSTSSGSPTALAPRPPSVGMVPTATIEATAVATATVVESELIAATVEPTAVPTPAPPPPVPRVATSLPVVVQTAVQTPTRAPVVVQTAVQTAPVASGSLEAQVRAAVEAYFPPSQWATAMRIARCESRFEPWQVEASGRHIGVFQVDPQFHGTVPPDIDGQVRQAAGIVARYGWGPWSCQ